MPTALTAAEARKAIRWFKRRMGLQDWRIEVELSDSVPEWCAETHNSSYVGHASVRVAFKHANVWVTPNGCATIEPGLEPAEPLEVLFHELIHLQCRDVGLADDSTPHVEYMLDRVAAVLAWAYRRGMKA